MTKAFEPAGRPLYDLDPQDWTAFRAQCHQALDTMIDFVSTVRDRPVWIAPSSEARAAFRQPMPHSGKSVAELLETFDRDIKPYGPGNLHPAFMGWVHGAGSPVGMLAARFLTRAFQPGRTSFELESKFAGSRFR